MRLSWKPEKALAPSAEYPKFQHRYCFKQKQLIYLSLLTCSTVALSDLSLTRYLEGKKYNTWSYPTAYYCDRPGFSSVKENIRPWQRKRFQCIQKQGCFTYAKQNSGEKQLLLLKWISYGRMCPQLIHLIWIHLTGKTHIAWCRTMGNLFPLLGDSLNLSLPVASLAWPGLGPIPTCASSESKGWYRSSCGAMQNLGNFQCLGPPSKDWHQVPCQTVLHTEAQGHLDLNAEACLQKCVPGDPGASLQKWGPPPWIRCREIPWGLELISASRGRGEAGHLLQPEGPNSG